MYDLYFITANQQQVVCWSTLLVIVNKWTSWCAGHEYQLGVRVNFGVKSGIWQDLFQCVPPLGLFHTGTSARYEYLRKKSLV